MPIRDYQEPIKNKWEYTILISNKKIKHYLYFQIIKPKPDMKPFLFGFTLITIFLFYSCNSNFKEKLVIENEKFSKTFSFNNKNAGKIEVEYFLKSNSEILNDFKSLPFFEFVIN